MKIEHFILGPRGWAPNNAKLPVLVYRGALPVRTADETATDMEQMFARNGWPPQWRDGIFSYHHYHSTAHEVLGFAAGEARLMLGGPEGEEVTVSAGDVALLPVGTAHCRVSSQNLLVVGAYPPGQSFDICRAAPSAEALSAMSSIDFPTSDPVRGEEGPLTQLWWRKSDA